VLIVTTFAFIQYFSESDTTSDASGDHSGTESIPPKVVEKPIKKKRKFGAPKSPNNVTPLCAPIPVVVSPSEVVSDDGSTSAPAAKKSKKAVDMLKNDVRSKYATIFAEAFNNFDKIEFKEILKQYCELDLFVIYELIGLNPLGSPKYIEVRGLDTVVSFWDSLFTTIPDSVFNVHSTKYKVLPNDYTSIVCAFSFRGTKVYNMAGVENNTAKNVMITQDPQAATSKLVASVVAGTNIPELDLHSNACTRESTSSQDFSIERSKMISTFVTVLGTLTFYVNSNKKIYRISFVHSVKM